MNRAEFDGPQDKKPGGRPRVVIVGAGFGGLWAAKTLSKSDDVDVLIIDRNNYHTFLPLLYQVAAAELYPEDIAYPIRKIVRRYKNVGFAMAEVTRIDLEQRVVYTQNDRGEPGVSFPYDYLILAAGSVTNFFGMEGVARFGFEMKDLDEGVTLRSHILSLVEKAAHESDPEKRRELLTFVVVGGGPTGVEFAATLAELIWSVLVKDFREIDFDEARVLLLEATGALLPVLPTSLQDYTARILKEKGVEVLLNTAVTGASEGLVELADGTRIPTHTLVWTAGVRANSLADHLGTPQARGGRLVVEPTLHIPDYPHVYAVGDIAYFEDDQGRPVPQVAPAALQQGEMAAKNILRDLAGESLESYQYRDRGTMVTIGRNTGVARVWGRSVRGFLAWSAWLVVHLVKLIGFRNRLAVLSDWAWNYLFYERAVRLIFHRPQRAPEPKVGE